MSVALALALVILPVLVGLVVGAWLRARGPRWLPLIGVAGVAAAAGGAFEMFQSVGAWDIAATAVAMIGGLLIDHRRLRGADVILLLAATTSALAALEIAVRLWLPSPPSYPPPDEASLTFTPEAWDAGCALLYGAASVDTELATLRRQNAGDRKGPGEKPLVLHLGDSMTFGDGVRQADAFPAVLGTLQPDVAHANYGMWAVGTDFEYLLLERLLAAHTPAMVVLHVYAANDIFDLDRPYACCNAGPLLDYSRATLQARCPTARWGLTRATRLATSPPPYALRVATGWSDAARHGAAAFSRLAFYIQPPTHFLRAEGDGSEEGWEHFTRIVREMDFELRRRGIPFVVNVLPSRRALDAADPLDSSTSRAKERVLAITAALGISTLDAWQAFTPAVRAHGSARYFLPEPDIHFSPEGHRLLAGWLAHQLPSASPPRP